MVELEAKDIEKHYPDGTQALRGVSFAVERGEFVAIMGPSGSGKSTLLHVLGFLDKQSKGTYLFEGKGIEDYTEEELAVVRNKRMGFVFQAFNLFPHLTAAQNVMLGLTKVRGKDAREARGIAEHWLERVGLGHKADALPAELSGGQQQRVGIARALAMEPKVLLLDEITSALDPELVGEVLEVVRSLAAEGMTMLMVTHEIAFARDASRRIVFMADGRVNASGPPAELLAAAADNPRLDAFLARFRASHF